jgi:high-affinity K+ transport system ATPase subunit B
MAGYLGFSFFDQAIAMKTKLLLLFSLCIMLMVCCTWWSLSEWNSELQYHIPKALLLLVASILCTVGAVVCFTKINRLS